MSKAEAFVLQLVVWIGIWLIDDFVATLLTLGVGSVVLAVLIIALVAEMIERSRVPRDYFIWMGFGLLAIITAAAVYVILLGGRLDFMDRH